MKGLETSKEHTSLHTKEATFLHMNYYDRTVQIVNEGLWGRRSVVTNSQNYQK